MQDPFKPNLSMSPAINRAGSKDNNSSLSNQLSWDYGSAMDFSANQQPNLINQLEFQKSQDKKKKTKNQIFETQQFTIKNFDGDSNVQKNEAMKNSRGQISPNHLTQLFMLDSSTEQEKPNSQNQDSMAASKSPFIQSGSLEWIPDAQAPACTKCHKAFNWRFRRHHCRICGKVYCNSCSQNSNITIDGEIKNVRVCKKCFELHNQLYSEMNKQKMLLRDKVSNQERIMDSYQFLENNSIDSRRVSQLRLGPSNESYKNEPSFLFATDEARTSSQYKDNMRSDSVMRRKSEIHLLSKSNVQTEENGIKTQGQLVIKSASNKQVMQKFLFEQQQTAIDDTVIAFDNTNNAMDISPLNRLPLETKAPQISNIPNLEKNQNLKDCLTIWIDKKLGVHIQKMIDVVISDFKIDSKKWRRLMVKCTQNAVQTIRPSSRLLNDSIDFNSFIKILTLEYPNQDKCQYVNGVVLKKDVAHRRMLNQIENPRVLLLGNSLGYVHDDDSLIDLSAEINQENYNMQIIMSKIQSVNPHIIFVEQEASRLALESLFKDQRTVVTNVAPKMMRMIARATQTIICPSTNLIDKNFIVGNCLKFRVEQIKPMGTDFQNQNGQEQISTLTGHTSLMFMEGCQSKLGCSIVISGPDMAELKNVRMALKKCLKTARTFLLEREYLRFIKPNPTNFIIINKVVEDEKEQNEPELTFNKFQDSREANYTSPQEALSAAWKRKNDPEFENLNSPFLYEKEMKRDFLVFELFSLVVTDRKEIVEDYKDLENGNQSFFQEYKQSDPNESMFLSADPKLARKSMKDNSVQIQADNNENKTDEASIRKKIKQMCQKPQKQIVQFYSEQSDVSLYSMIKKMSLSALSLCEVDDCRKIRLIHTDYFYHNNGCIEIKYREDAASSSLQQSLLTESEDFPVSVFCYCNQCKSLVISKTEVPIQMLEMSFYKLLEQFFYNQEIVANGHINLSNFPEYEPCPHSFHKDCSMVFKYGPIKIMISFEPQDEYVLDLTHFGSMSGIFSPIELKQKAEMKLLESQQSVFESFYFIEEKTRMLEEWLNIAAEEFPIFLGSAISPTINKMKSFVQKLIEEIIIRKDLIFKDFFGIEHMKKQNTIEEIIPSNSKRLLDQVFTEMQANRVHMILGNRISELLFLIRKAYNIGTVKFLTKVFGKRSPFVIYHEQLQKNVNATTFNAITDEGPRFQTLNDQSRYKSNFNSFREQPAQSFDGNRTTPSLMMSQDYLKKTDTDSSSLTDQQLNGPSKKIKDIYIELIDFENQLIKNKFIAEIVSQSCLIQCGFDQNKVNINPNDIGSLIAYALSSNMYINGLAKIEYMQIEQNFKPYRIAENLNNSSTDFQLKQLRQTTIEAGHKVMLVPDTLNDEIIMNMAENELLRENQAFSFVLSASTSNHAEMQIFRNLKQVEQISIEDDNGNQTPQLKFFKTSNDGVIDLEFLENPISEALIKQLYQLETSIEKMKIVHQARLTVNKVKGVQLAQSHEELDFTALALTGASLNLAKSQHTNDRITLNQNGTPNNNRVTSSTINNNLNVILKVIEIKDDNNETNDTLNGYTLSDIYSDIYHAFHKPLDFSVKIYFPNQFEALRKVYCGSYNDFLHSIYKSEIWGDNTGGKTKSPFLKSHDHKYVIKVVKSSEVKMFETISDSYFEYMCRSFGQQCPTSIAKMLGIFRIRMRVGTDGKVSQTYCILMENLLLNVDESVAIKYDLKGSERSRFVQIKNQKQVALDTNFLYDMKSRPIPLQFQMRKMLQIAIANDSLYLSQHQIIDYSLMLIIDPIKKTIRVGIIDYIQQYTIEKELESYLKQTVSNLKPTIISPDEYKQRFRTAMDKYFLGLIPDEDSEFNQLICKRFNAQKIQWFTKDTDLQ